jgi:predicted esterase
MCQVTSSRRGASWVRFLGAFRPPGRRPSGRRFRPALHPGAWLEPRRLPSAAVAPGAIGAPAHAHLAAGAITAAANPVVIQQPDATIVLPPDLQPGRTYPLVVAFSYNGRPAGDQYTALTLWKTLGPDEGWIVYASKQYSNSAFYAGPAATRNVARTVMASLGAAIARLPVDRSRIILTGLSGGGNFAEYLNLAYPGFAAAVIDNSGRIPFELFGKKPTSPLPLPGAGSFGNSRQIAILLASPSDSEFYNDAVRSDLPYYRSVGWQVQFLSFPGGHNFAPFSVYQRAIQWLETRPSWR